MTGLDVLVITPGEPAGIGPDLMVMLAQQPRKVSLVVAADADMLCARAARLELPLRVDENLHAPACDIGALTVLNKPLRAPVVPGMPDPANVPGVLSALDEAIKGCLSGRFRGLVTGPMQKSVVNDAGIRFSGHTEYLAQAAGAEDVVMLLVAGELRVALATTHLPLQAVPAALTAELLTRRLSIFHNELIRKFDVSRPHILVAGVNPHAGEQGHLGREEIDVIAPVVDALNDKGMHLTGPLPADTLFTPQHLRGADGVMAMYHDQGLPVVKYAGFGEAVNVTLGLPFVRTSVDHGTALDRAGRGTADSGSLAAAIEMARVMTQQA